LQSLCALTEKPLGDLYLLISLDLLAFSFKDLGAYSIRFARKDMITFKSNPQASHE